MYLYAWNLCSYMPGIYVSIHLECFAGLERQLEEKKGEVKRLEDKLCKREKTGKEQRSENERVREELVAARSDREELLSKIEELNKRLKRLQEVGLLCK